MLTFGFHLDSCNFPQQLLGYNSKVIIPINSCFLGVKIHLWWFNTRWLVHRNEIQICGYAFKAWCFDLPRLFSSIFKEKDATRKQQCNYQSIFVRGRNFHGTFCQKIIFMILILKGYNILLLLLLNWTLFLRKYV